MKKNSTWWIAVIALTASTFFAGVNAAENMKNRLASTLVLSTGGAKAPDKNGFLQRWIVLEPISVDGRLTDSAVQATVKQPTLLDQFSKIPVDGEIVTIEENEYRWHALDTTEYNLNLYHFAYALKKPTSNVLFWVVSVVNSPRDMSDVRLAIGSNAASIWWLNGEEVISLYNDRQTVIDDGVSKRLKLKKGPNVIRAAIINAGGATDFTARFLDEINEPVKDLKITLSETQF